ncbi:MAG: hypothetical protein HUU34_12755 [Saprospiraceae bacterium]|nr:hypothetical protein [Saprospiraceae bacterium]
MKRKLTPKGWFPHLYFLLSFLVMAAAGLSLSLAPNRVFTPQISVSAFEPFCSTGDSLCLGFADIPFSVSVDCGQEVPQLTATVDGQPVPNAISGAYPDYVFSGSFAVGIHELVLQVADSCGQTAAEMLSFEVVDCQAPGVTWILTYTTIFFPVIPYADVDGDGEIDLGVIEVHAEDFVLNANADCTLPLRYSIHKMEDIMDGSDLPNPEQTSIIFTCFGCVDEVPVRLYAWDSAFNPYSVQPDGSLGGANFIFYDTNVFFTDMFSVCWCETGPTVIQGVIATATWDVVKNVDVALTGYTTLNYLTGTNGAFSFYNLHNGQNYTITPYKNDNHKNGVSTFDIILINKHILNVQPLPQNYHRIAADVNKSKAITVADIVLIRKLLLGLIDVFPNNTSWRFVPKDYVFPVPNNPWFEDFPEQKIITDLEGGTTIADFVAIKVGDVNINAITDQ